MAPRHRFPMETAFYPISAQRANCTHRAKNTISIHRLLYDGWREIKLSLTLEMARLGSPGFRVLDFLGTANLSISNHDILARMFLPSIM